MGGTLYAKAPLDRVAFEQAKSFGQVTFVP